MVGDPSMSVPPQTPRQASQPPMAGSPFPGLPASADRKPTGPGVLANAPPLSRAPTSDAPNGASATAPATAAGPNPPVQTQIVPQLPPLPTNVNLNPKVTRVSVVPLVDSETTIPALAPEEIAEVQAWMAADREYEGRYKKMRERGTEELREAVVKRRPWYEKDPLEDPRAVRRRKDKFEIVGIHKAKEEKARKKSGRREGFRL